ALVPGPALGSASGSAPGWTLGPAPPPSSGSVPTPPPAVGEDAAGTGVSVVGREGVHAAASATSALRAATVAARADLRTTVTSRSEPA
ncbi:MAG: hypothetical protein Q4G64_02150, partial [bacterium]|nr:hypothetical protein [bacterium]